MGAFLTVIALGTAAAAEVGTSNDAQAEGPFRHLKALHDVAVANGGNRAAGTAGYDRSVDYVADRLREAGYTVRLEDFTFPFFDERTPPALAVSAGPPVEIPQDRDAMRVLHHSGSGTVTARLQPVDLGLGEGPAAISTSGCEREDFAGFEAGRIALVRRGTCPFQVKVEHAVAAGAAAVVVMNQGTEGQTAIFGGRLAGPATIPVLGVTTEIGRRLDAAARDPAGLALRLAVDIDSGERTSRNVIAERPDGERADAPVVMVGAHLDSVKEGPGINDNASGTAAVLEAALRLAGEPARPIRFAFWGAEELGLIGSRRHVDRMSEEERRRIALYVNLDMVGSPNPGRFLRSSLETGPGLATDVRQAIGAYFRDRSLAADERSSRERRGGGSDDASFAQKGIPTIMLYTGAGETKAVEQADRFGGTPGQAYDPCYHRACDALENIDRPVLHHMTEALMQGLRQVPVASSEPAKPAP